MSRFTRLLVLGATLAAVYLSGTTALAQQADTYDKAVGVFRQGERASQQQAGTDGNGLSGTHTPPSHPVTPSEQPGLPVSKLGVVMAFLALIGASAAITARRARRRMAARHAA